MVVFPLRDGFGTSVEETLVVHEDAFHEQSENTDMKSRRIPIVTLLSTILLAAAVVSWIRGRHHTDILGVFTPSGHLQALATDRRGVLFSGTNIPFGDEKGLSADAMSLGGDDFEIVHNYVFDPANKDSHVIGFHFVDGTVAPWGWKFHAILVPYWALAGVLALLPARLFRQTFMKWRWRRQGRCGGCGYDISRSAGRCPECGRPINEKLIAQSFASGRESHSV